MTIEPEKEAQADQEKDIKILLAELYKHSLNTIAPLDKETIPDNPSKEHRQLMEQAERILREFDCVKGAQRQLAALEVRSILRAEKINTQLVILTWVIGIGTVALVGLTFLLVLLTLCPPK